MNLKFFFFWYDLGPELLMSRQITCENFTKTPLLSIDILDLIFNSEWNSIFRTGRLEGRLPHRLFFFVGEQQHFHSQNNFLRNNAILCEFLIIFAPGIMSLLFLKHNYDYAVRSFGRTTHTFITRAIFWRSVVWFERSPSTFFDNLISQRRPIGSAKIIIGLKKEDPIVRNFIGPFGDFTHKKKHAHKKMFRILLLNWFRGSPNSKGAGEGTLFQ